MAEKKTPKPRAKGTRRAGVKKAPVRRPPARKKAPARKATATKAPARKKAARPEPVSHVPTGPRLTAAQQGLRDSYILALRASGHTWSEVAAAVGINEKAAREAAKARREAMPLSLSMDPAEIVERSFEGLQTSIADLERLAMAAADAGQLAVAVGAKGRANDAREKVLALLQATGRLPEELGALRHLIDLRAMAVKMLDTMDRFEQAVGAIEFTDVQRAQLDDAVGEVRETFNELIGLEERPALTAAA